jgi:hypothetical protein
MKSRKIAMAISKLLFYLKLNESQDENVKEKEKLTNNCLSD